jgi:AcrR family transcriptional regulator
MVIKSATPAPSRRERKKVDTRRRILTVALDLFSRHGLEAVTVDHIADMADLGKGTIYNYFPTKEDIVVAFMAELESEIQAKTARLVSSGASLERMLLEVIRHQFRLKRPYHAFVRVMLGQMFQRTAEFMPYLVEMQKSIDPNLERLFRFARDRGLVRTDIPIPDLIVAFKVLHLGLPGLWAIEGPPFAAADRVTKHQVALFCAGLEAAR